MIIVCDVETSGFKHFWHDIISVGLVALNDDLSPSHTFYGTCKPWQPKNVNPESCEVHGFSIPEMMTFQEPEQLALKILHFLAPLRTPDKYFHFVSHSQGLFDFNFMQSFFIKTGLQFSFYKVFNTEHTEFTVKMGKSVGYEESNLKAWAKRLNLSFNHHNALDDALLCASVYKFLKEQKDDVLKSNSEQKPRVHRKRTNKIELSNGFVATSSQLSIV